MDETIEILSEKVLGSISGYSLPDQAYLLQEIAERLREMAEICLFTEYGHYDNDLTI